VKASSLTGNYPLAVLQAEREKGTFNSTEDAFTFTSICNKL
jgi:hypothetical protein